MAAKRYYGKGLPRINPASLKGSLIVLEGPDGAGRSTQIALLRDWLRRAGYPTVEIGLKRSTLVGPELMEAMQGNTLCPITLSLFYATDFADQLEHSIIPSLRAGFVVLADRYIYTLMVRDVVRGIDSQWIKDVYKIALVPDLVLYIKVKVKTLAERSFQKKGVLDYWESGMDIQRSGDMYECFVRYQTHVQREYDKLAQEFSFKTVNGDSDPVSLHREVQAHVAKLLNPLSKKRGLKITPSASSDGAGIQYPPFLQKHARSR